MLKSEKNYDTLTNNINITLMRNSEGLRVSVSVRDRVYVYVSYFLMLNHFNEFE